MFASRIAAYPPFLKQSPSMRHAQVQCVNSEAVVREPKLKVDLTKYSTTLLMERFARPIRCANLAGMDLLSAPFETTCFASIGQLSERAAPAFVVLISGKVHRGASFPLRSNLQRVRNKRRTL